jgi:hypothetical protein
MVKIRLTRGGAKKRPFYHIIVTDSRNARDGLADAAVCGTHPKLPDCVDPPVGNLTDFVRSHMLEPFDSDARIEALILETGAGVQQDFLRAEAALFQARAGHARARYDEILALVGRARAQGALDRDWMDQALEARR